ncbi:UDP-glucuronic acid decarboxylase family protein [Roseobacteraceae bacterium NS-SX3]
MLQKPGLARQTVVITGGAGFLGSHLCARKLGQGQRVICLDNLQTGRFGNISPLLAHPNFQFVKHDVTHPYSVDGPVSEIYNLACAASPEKYQKDPIHTFKTCVMGMMHALDLARAKGARVFQASTSEVYGDPSVSPQPEQYRGNVNTCGPRSCYDEGKRAAETLCHDYHTAYGTDVRLARIFNTYGPHMDPGDGRVVTNLVMQALQGKPLTIYGDGQQTRSFCYVDDLLDGIEALVAHSGPLPDPVNLGNPCEFTMLELAELVLRLTGARSGLAFLPMPKDDPRQRKPDIQEAQSKLRWAPSVPLEDGLKRTIRHFQGNLGEPAPLEAAARP